MLNNALFKIEEDQDKKKERKKKNNFSEGVKIQIFAKFQLLQKIKIQLLRIQDRP